MRRWFVVSLGLVVVSSWPCSSTVGTWEWDETDGVENDGLIQGVFDVFTAHGCALVISGVMIHGRMYLTEKNIYFRANIVGIVTKVSRVVP